MYATSIANPQLMKRVCKRFNIMLPLFVHANTSQGLATWSMSARLHPAPGDQMQLAGSALASHLDVAAT